MLKDFAQKNNIQGYRLKQFNQAFYQSMINSFDELTTWSKDLREKLKSDVPFSTIEEDRRIESKDGKTIKILFCRMKDGNKFESVLMRHKDGRNTVCVSCMIGCPVKCKFCATGKLGFKGNLSAREIVDQVMYFARELKKEDQVVTNVVYMGMGEPMLNIDEVEESIDILTNPELLGLSKRRITVSTSGYIQQLKQFIEDGYRGKLAISLHAPTQELRERLMPLARNNPLHSLIETLDRFTTLTNKRISYEYILIKDVNDSEEDAKILAKLFRRRLAHLNLIPYNPIRGEKFERSDPMQIKRFEQVLKKHEISYTIRVTMGDDVNAACGQLAGEDVE